MEEAARMPTPLSSYPILDRGTAKQLTAEKQPRHVVPDALLATRRIRNRQTTPIFYVPARSWFTEVELYLLRSAVRETSAVAARDA